MLRMEGTYYARSEHGGHKVVADSQGFLVAWPTGEIRYPSARQTLIALVNQTPHITPGHRDPKVSFDRYFRRGSHKKSSPPQPVLDVFSMFGPEITVAASTPKVRSSESLSIAAPALGVDLARRGHEVRKLFYAGYGRRVLRYGYDPEDVLQEVYKGILVRNQGKCPFDASKSSFGHYVHMVAGCIVSNYRRRYSRLEANEQFGYLNIDGQYEDVAEADLAVVDPEQEDTCRHVASAESLTGLVRHEAYIRDYDPEVASECLALMIQGQRKSEIARTLGESPSFVARLLRMVREVASMWRTRHVIPHA